MTRTIVIKIELPDGVQAPDIDFVDALQEPPHMAELPPVAAAPPPAQPSCPQHGPMTYHAPGTSKQGKALSARYSCDQKVDGEFCPTKPVWLKG